MGRTTVLIILHGSKQPALGASTRRPILVYQAATSEEELRRIPLPRTPVNNGLWFDASWAVPDLEDAFLGAPARPERASNARYRDATTTRVRWPLPGLAGPPNDPCPCPL